MSGNAAPKARLGFPEWGLIVVSFMAFVAWLAFQWLTPELMARLPPSKIARVFQEELLTARGSLLIMSGACLAWAGIGWKRAGRFPSCRTLVILILMTGAAIRWSSVDGALDRMPRPDGVHFSLTAMELAQHGSWLIQTGPQRLPSRTLPGASLVMLATQWLAPERMGMGIYAVWLTGLFSVAAAYALGRRVFSASVGVVAAVLVAVSPIHIFYSRQLMSDVPWGCLVLVTAWLILSPGDSRGRVFLAGLLAGLGMLFKPSHLLIQAAFVGCSLLFAWRERSLRRALFFVTGVLVGDAPALAYAHGVLGSVLRTPYHIYQPDWATAANVLHGRYLFGPPIARGFWSWGNVPYYLLVFFGLDPRPEKMPWVPPLALAWVYAGVSRWRPRRDALSLQGRRLLGLCAAAGVSYGGACLLYSWQDPRFFLPIIPLALVAGAWPLETLWRRLAGPVQQWILLLAWSALLSVACAMPWARIHASLGHDREMWAKLSAAARDFEAVVTDEEPALLTYAGVWTEHTRIVPMCPPGTPWVSDHAEELLRTRGVVVASHEGTVAQVRRLLAEGRRIAVWTRHPHSMPAVYDAFERVFVFRDLPEYGLSGLREVTH